MATKVPDIDREALYRLYVIERWSMERIGRLYGISRTKVRHQLRKIGIVGRGNQTPANRRLDIDDETIRSLYVDYGYSLEDIGRFYGLSSSAIGYRLDTLGIEKRPPSSCTPMTRAKLQKYWNLARRKGV